MRKSVERQVQGYANGRCEYCKIPKRCDAVPFHMDHIIAKQHGGRTKAMNLAYCCANCNSFKGSNIAGIDPISRRITQLFNPRKEKWTDHFKWSGPVLRGLTPQARATIRVLKINDPLNVRLRDSLMHEGLFE